MKRRVKQVIRRRSRASAIALRRAILDAALTVFAEQGYEGASTRAIAAAAGVEQGHLAYYFKSKEAIWREVIRSFNAGVEQLLDERLREADLKEPVKAARAVLPDFLRHFADNHRLTRLMLQEFSVVSPRHEWLVTQIGRPIWRRLQPLFEALHRNERVVGRDATFSYFAMIGSAMIFFGSQSEVRSIAGLDTHDGATVEDYITYVLRSVLRVDGNS